MKFSFQYVKQNPVMFGVIFIVFGLGIWLLINKGHSASSAGGGTVTTVQNGPTDAQIAAATSVQIAQINAAGATAQTQAQLAATQDQDATQVSIAALAANLQAAQSASAERVANNSTQAQLDALQAQLDNTAAINANNNATAFATAKLSTDAAVQVVQSNNQLTHDLSAMQATAFETQSFLAAIPSLKYASYAKYLIADAANIATTPLTPANNNGTIPGQNTGSHV